MWSLSLSQLIVEYYLLACNWFEVNLFFSRVSHKRFNFNESHLNGLYQTSGFVCIQHTPYRIEHCAGHCSISEENICLPIWRRQEKIERDEKTHTHTQNLFNTSNKNAMHSYKVVLVRHSQSAGLQRIIYAAYLEQLNNTPTV